MKVKYLYEGLFKTPAQLRAEAERREELGDEADIASSFNSAVLNPIRHDIKVYGTQLNGELRQTLKDAYVVAARSLDMDTAHVGGYYRTNNEDSLRLGKTIAKECQELIESHLNLKNEEIGDFLDAVRNNGKDIWNYPEDDARDAAKSCKRVVLLPILMNITGNSYDNTYLYFRNGNPLDIEIYAAATGFDYDDAGFDEYMEILDLIKTDDNDPVIDKYFNNIIKESHTNIAAIRTGIQNLARIIEGYIGECVRKKYSAFDDSLIHEWFPVSVRFIIGRACNQDAPYDIVKGINNEVGSHLRYGVAQVGEFGSLSAEVIPEANGFKKILEIK